MNYIEFLGSEVYVKGLVGYVPTDTSISIEDSKIISMQSTGIMVGIVELWKVTYVNSNSQVLTILVDSESVGVSTFLALNFVGTVPSDAFYFKNGTLWVNNQFPDLLLNGSFVTAIRPTDFYIGAEQIYSISYTAGSRANIIYTNSTVADVFKALASEGGSGIADITYSELYDKTVNGGLTPGAWYRLTDYKSVNFLNGLVLAESNPTPTDPNFDPREIYTGETEVLILQAKSEYEIAEAGYSETFNGDIVQYQPFTNKIGIYFDVYNGQTLPDASTVSDFDLQWDGTNVYFNMPTEYPALFGQYFYLYAEFEETPNGPISSKSPTNISFSGDISGLGDFTGFNIQPTTLTGIGSGLTIDVEIKGGILGIQNFISGGDDYAVGDTLLILGSLLGGTDGVNDVTLTVLTIDTLPFSYYQEGTFDPLTPNISIPQYPYSSDSIELDYPKQLSRIKIEEEGLKVVLIDLTEDDYNNYINDTLYVETYYALGDAYGYITRRQDTFRNIDVPFDFRGKKYRRFEVDLSGVISGGKTGYYGLGDDFLGQGTTGNYQDFKCFGEDGYESYNIKWTGIGGISKLDNFVCTNTFIGNTLTETYNFYDNTISGSFNENIIEGSFYGNTIGGCYRNEIKGLFVNNILEDGSSNNKIRGDIYDNKIKTFFENNVIDSFKGQFSSNTIGSSFKNNTINSSFNSNTIGNNMEKNIINEVFANNTISNAQFRLNIINTAITSIDFTSATHVYGVYTCELLRASDTTNYLNYFDGTANQFTAITA